MENLQHPLNNRKAMEQELIRGHENANQLLEVIVHNLNFNPPYHDVERSMLPFAEDLVRKVLRSFTNTLLLLHTKNVVDEKDFPTTIKESSTDIFPKIEEDTDMASKSTFFSAENQRGCYRKKSNKLTWEKDSTILIDDGYVWRKYGQKKLINVKYPRSYYRCTYKDEQDCPAIKQVQRIQENPPLYRTTYYDHHICQSYLNSEMALEHNTSSGSSTFFSFNSFLPSKEQQSFLSSLPAYTKQEPVNPFYDIADNHLTSLDYPLSCDYDLAFDYLRDNSMLSSTDGDVCEPMQFGF